MSRMLRWTSVCLLGAATSACAASKYDLDAGNVSETGEADSSAAPETGDTLDDSLEPRWWKLGAAISITGGLLIGEESSLGLTLLSEDGETICEDAVVASALAAELTTPDASIFAWWRVGTSAPAGDCAAYANPLPETLLLGVGAMYPDIRANLEPAGLAEVADSLNGAYGSLDGGQTVVVFGVAGTAAAYAGEVAATTAAPLADGVWIVRAIYPFAY